jgi:hypothetical protein
MTPTPLIRLNLSTTCAAVLPYFEAMSFMNYSFKILTSSFWQESPLANGVWATTVIPFLLQKSTKLCWFKYGWVYIWFIIGFILQNVRRSPNNWPLKFETAIYFVYPFLTHSYISFQYYSNDLWFQVFPSWSISINGQCI